MSNWKYSKELAIVGIGEHPTGFFPETTPYEWITHAIKEAIDNSGISKDEIDAIIPHICIADRNMNTDLAWSRFVEELGGPEVVLALVTDNASNMKNCWARLVHK